MAGVPLELVKYDAPTGKFIVGSDALDVLRKVNKPLGVVAVCGRARQGKSFILNQLLQQTSGHGFTVGPTHRPCTKGLWMWSSPQRRVAADGTETYLVLLDTEGIDAYDQTAQYSTQIFSLAVLLSCLFVYNHMGGIDESALDRLSLVTEMTKHIRVKAGKGDDESLGEFTPSFLWLLRDFYLKLEEEGRKITAKDYLETALHPVDGEGPSVKAKNDIRASIKSLFPDRDCFSLVRPMNDEVALANLDNVPRDQLRPEFSQGVATLVKYIFQKAQPKRFGNGFMTGPVLAGLVEAYVKAINNGAVPTIATAWQGVAESESRRAGDHAEQCYKEAFNAAIVADEKELLAEHQRCLDLAKAVFADIAVGEEGIRKAHEAKFLTSVERYFKDLSGRKLAEAASRVNEMLYKANMALTKAARSGSSMDNMQEELGKFIKEYAATASGPTKWEKLAEFLKDMYPSLASEAIAQAQAVSKKQISASKEELDQAQAQIKAMEDRLAKTERQHQSASSTVSSLQEALAEAQQQVEKLRAELEVRTARCAALEAQVRDTAATGNQRAAAAEAEAQARVKAIQEQHAKKAQDLQAALTAEQAKSSSVQTDVANLNTKLRSLNGQVDSLTAEVKGWQDKYQRELDEKVRIMSERDAIRNSTSNVQAERDAANRERAAATMRLQEMAARMEADERFKAEMQAKLDAMIVEAQQARADALAQRSNAAAKARTPLGAAGDDIMDAQDAGGLRFNGLSIQELKDMLTSSGHEEAVWGLQNRKPPAKKADWLQLAQQLVQA